MIGPVRISRGLIVAAAVALLAGCAGGNSSADIAPAAAPPPVDPAPQASVQQQPLAPPPAPAGRATRGAPPPPPAQPAAPPPAAQAALTPEEVKAQCWMKYENDKRIKNIDARLQLVEKCVSDTSRGQPAPGAVSWLTADRYAASACAAVIASPATVVRRMSRGCVSSKRRTRCMVWRLSHTTRSYCRQRWT